MSTRQPMSPEEFDRNCRLLIRGCPTLSETSGYRGVVRNSLVGGHAESKHLLGMARDFESGHEEELLKGERLARILGFWHDVHDSGSGLHLHVQGLEPGPVPDWWMLKYGKG